jgi:hypothetical protein
MPWRDQDPPATDVLLQHAQASGSLAERVQQVVAEFSLDREDSALSRLVRRVEQAQKPGIPWDDASGERLREWMGVDTDVFSDESRIAIIPMGYCYPGRGDGGDLPPRRECAELWLDQILSRLPRIESTLLIGQYAQRHLATVAKRP